MLLSSEYQKKIHRFIVPQGITFNFNPSAAPHQGGLWESAVKRAKYSQRVMGNSILTLLDFITLVTQTEAMLSSHQVTPMSNDSDQQRRLNSTLPQTFLDWRTSYVHASARFHQCTIQSSGKKSSLGKQSTSVYGRSGNQSISIYSSNAQNGVRLQETSMLEPGINTII